MLSFRPLSIPPLSSISKGRNDFTHHQLKDYDVFSVKKLEIRLTEKSGPEIPKGRGAGGSEAFGKKNSYLSHLILAESFPKWWLASRSELTSVSCR